MPRVAIQVAHYFSSKELRTVLDSLQAQTFQDFEFYGYENSCDKDEESKVRDLLAQYPGMKSHVIVGKRNLGFGAHNFLFNIQQADYTLVLNDDAYLEPTYLERLVARLDADPEAGSACGIVYRWTEQEPETVTDESVVDTAGIDYRSLGQAVDRWAGLSRKEIADQLNEARIFGVSGAVALYRRSAVLAVSPEQTLYDPTFFMYKEDVDLAIRLKRGGWLAWFDPEAIAFHRRGIQSEKKGWFSRWKNERRRPKHLRRMSYRNQWMLYVYHGSFALGAKDFFRSMGIEIGRSLGAISVSPVLWIKSVGSVIASLPQAFRRRGRLKKLGLKSIRLLNS